MLFINQLITGGGHIVSMGIFANPKRRNKTLIEFCCWSIGIFMTNPNLLGSYTFTRLGMSSPHLYLGSGPSALVARRPPRSKICWIYTKKHLVYIRFSCHMLPSNIFWWYHLIFSCWCFHLQFLNDFQRSSSFLFIVLLVWFFSFPGV